MNLLLGFGPEDGETVFHLVEEEPVLNPRRDAGVDCFVSQAGLVPMRPLTHLLPSERRKDIRTKLVVPVIQELEIPRRLPPRRLLEPRLKPPGPQPRLLDTSPHGAGASGAPRAHSGPGRARRFRADHATRRSRKVRGCPSDCMIEKEEVLTFGGTRGETSECIGAAGGGGEEGGST